MTYKLLVDEFGGRRILRLEDQASIPISNACTDYQEYLRWLAEGNEPLPADPIN